MPSATAQYDDAEPKQRPEIKAASAPTVEELLTETNSLLRRLVLAMEIFHGTEIKDPH